MSMWKRHIRNPTQPLGSGKIPTQQFARREADRQLNFRIDDRGSFVAAALYATEDYAEKDIPEFTAWVKEHLEPRFGPLEITQKAKCLIVIRPKTDANKLDTMKNGDPYIDSKQQQTRASDEPPTVFKTGLLTGDVKRDNPPDDVIITVPHATDDQEIEGHDYDPTAEPMAREICERLLDHGIDPILMIGNVNRERWDLNREESSGRPFHIKLDERLPNASLLLDIHSFPRDFKQWKDHDVVIFARGPYHREGNNEDTMELARAIGEACPELRVLVDTGTEEMNYIQNKGLWCGVESHLIEVAEDIDHIPVAHAIAEYAAGLKSNIPTQLPAGAHYQQFTIKLPVIDKQGKPRRINQPEFMELELEDLGFKQVKKLYDSTNTLVLRATHAIPTGFPIGPTIHFQRNQTHVFVYSAAILTNEELQVINDLVNEAAESQPLPNPDDFDFDSYLRDTLRELKVTEPNDLDKLVKLIKKDNRTAIDGLVKHRNLELSSEDIDTLQGLNESLQEKGSMTAEEWEEEKKETDKEIAKTAGKVTKDTDDEDIILALEKKGLDIPRTKKGTLNRSAALQAFHIITTKSNNQDIEKELKHRKLDIPEKDNKFNRKKALDMLKGPDTAAQTTLTKFAGPKSETGPKAMHLSTRVTQLVMSELIPGSAKKPEDTKDKGQKQKGQKQKGQKQKGQRGRDDDWSKEFRMIDGEKTSKSKWVKGRSVRDITNWDEWNNAEKANPPDDSHLVDDLLKRIMEFGFIKIPPESQGMDSDGLTIWSQVSYGDMHPRLRYPSAYDSDLEDEFRGLLHEVAQLAEKDNSFVTRHKLKECRRIIHKLNDHSRYSITPRGGWSTETTQSKGWNWLQHKTNPPVDVHPVAGAFAIDGEPVTGEYVNGARISVTAGGKASELWINEIIDPPEDFGIQYGRLVRVNMFRRKAGFSVLHKRGGKWQAKKGQPDYLISVETGGKHFYARSRVEIKGWAKLAHFPEKKSEPRLRIETRGILASVDIRSTPNEKVRIRGREHTLYEALEIMHENDPQIESRYGTDIGEKPESTWLKQGLFSDKPARVGPHRRLTNPQKRLPGMSLGTLDAWPFRDEIDDKEAEIEKKKAEGWVVFDRPTWMGESTIKKEKGMLLSGFNWLVSPEAEDKLNARIDKRTQKKIEEAREKARGSARLDEFKRNPTAYAEQYVADHELMTAAEEKKFKRVKLKGKVGTSAFFEQICKRVQVFGEGQGWVRNGYLYWKKGPGHENFVSVDGHMLANATAWMHTHPAAWEPSQSSPDDFKVIHGLFTNHGIRDHFTIIADRIDWFRLKKKDRISVEEMVDVIEDFENEIDEGFSIAEEAFQNKMGDKPYLTSDQTRYIVKHFNKVIPEFSMTYKAYSLSPQQMRGRVVPNPPPRVPVIGFFRSGVQTAEETA
jgi:hypothetical protein